MKTHTLKHEAKGSRTWEHHLQPQGKAWSLCSTPAPCPGKLWSNFEEIYWKRDTAPFPSHGSQRPHTHSVHFKCRNWGIKPWIQRYRMTGIRKSPFHLRNRWGEKNPDHSFLQFLWLMQDIGGVVPYTWMQIPDQNTCFCLIRWLTEK